MRLKQTSFAVLSAAIVVGSLGAQSSSSPISDRPDPKEIPLPPIKTSMPDMPGVDQLPSRPAFGLASRLSTLDPQPRQFNP